MDDRSRYFNTGVMLGDPLAMQSFGLLEKFRQAYRQYETHIRYADQCVLNHVLERQATPIDPNWNNLFNVAQSQGRLVDFTIEGKPAILHYTGAIKPWMAWCADDVSDFWLSYGRLLGLDRARLVREPKTVAETLATADKFEAAGDFRSSVALKNKVIQHYMHKEAQSRR